MDTLIYGDGTKTILLRMKWRFQIYISFVENIKDNYEKLSESGLKCLNKYRFYTLANNHLWQVKTLEYEINFKISGLLT